MKEGDLVSLGFERTDVTAEESGDKPFYYFCLDFGLSRGISLISCDDEQAKEDGWYVEIFEDSSIRFNEYEDVKDLIRIIKKGIND
jgi:hypothetical protein